MWETINAKVLHGDDIWRCRSSTASTALSAEDRDKCWVIVWYDDADAEGA